MSIESDAAKWKSNVLRIRELDPDGTVLNDLIIRLPYSKELSWLVNRY